MMASCPQPGQRPWNLGRHAWWHENMKPIRSQVPSFYPCMYPYTHSV